MTDTKYGKYFASNRDWERFSNSRPDLALKTQPSQVQPFDIKADREAQAVDEDEWATAHPLEEFGYSARLEKVVVRDGHKVEIKIYRPLKTMAKDLPLLFVTHGGGWVQGTFVTEEAWLLYPIFQNFEFVVVSVDYRLAPEFRYPTYVNDCWDVLQAVVTKSEVLCFDSLRVYLAGSSAGACLAATLSQKAHAASIPLAGIILNVPVTCHPMHFPVDKYEYNSYEQCFGTLLGSSEMQQVWDIVVPNVLDGAMAQVSPLLGVVAGLPPHVVFVAGQDPLRDEGLAYAEKLEQAGVMVTTHIYPGVPHTFAEFWELEMTTRFCKDLVEGIRTLLG